MRAKSQAQPNIALVKYWGKRDAVRNLPAVGSLSITLDALYTRMEVEVGPAPGQDCLRVNGEPNTAMLPRVSRCLDSLAGAGRPAASITSESNFPIAAGLASSASAFAALVVAADAAFGGSRPTLELARLAGRASGSAARSLYGGFVELANGRDDIELERLAGPDDWPLTVVVAVTASGPKPIGSGEAMTASARTSPFYPSWVERQDQDLELARSAVVSRDFEKLAAVAESSCLKMHSVMWTTRPPIVYWNAATLSCMEAVRSLQRDGHPVFFTIDAGPQVKAVCLPESATLVARTLEAVPGVESVLTTGLGEGARVLERR